MAEAERIETDGTDVQQTDIPPSNPPPPGETSPAVADAPEDAMQRSLFIWERILPDLQKITGDTRQRALLIWHKLIPELERLAAATKRSNIEHHVARIDFAVRRALHSGEIGFEGHADRNERNARMLQWSHKAGYTGVGAFEIQGDIITKNMPWGLGLLEGILRERTTQISLSRQAIRDASYRTLKGLARMFDPGIHGDDFLQFAEPFLRGAARHCIRAGECIVPEKAFDSDLEALLIDPDKEIAPEYINPAGRGQRLKQWGVRKSFLGENTFGVQRAIISSYMRSVHKIADAKSTGTGTCSASDLRDAGYRLMKGLVSMFDPGEHGEDFWAFAQPHFHIGMDACNAASKVVIPEIPDRAYLVNLRASEPTAHSTDPPPQPPEPPKDPDPPPRPPEPPKDPDPPPQPPEPPKDPDPPPQPPEPPKDPDPPPQPPEPPKDPDPPPPETPRDTDPPLPPKPTPEEIEEQKRQRRFCRFARDSLGIAVGQEDFPGAVEGVCGKLENLVGSIVSGLHLPGKIRGGRTAVRKEGTRLLPDIVVRYDPPNFPDAGEAKGRFITHVKNRLQPQLEAFVRQNG